MYAYAYLFYFWSFAKAVDVGGSKVSAKVAVTTYP
jgi:hypothetical protein